MNEKLSIKQMRVLRGYSQESVSNHVSISREHLGKMENDPVVLKNAKIQTILNLLNYYEFEINQLNFFDD
ncbi:XRE family transcriptional regulator [Erysipelothrix sp. strain 2 (EsS2-7-Brazil)]|uniref:helix-turn-helix transcriptional regulator n=1 Tax=Erysipelothrix sp. strain 2 (EsS2-7-Brazil) TaxID=2500579 RepID=UPI00190A0D92|nr:helix-turn-helix transcriptional regulator [Erysipelothrix sp. strain 2 (EsS2-7-Brazil)]MBK2403888.1 XRE family transcriptional regulator [Erysipelothrix sp. strain 2 (EsS2-7-Brazil)]